MEKVTINPLGEIKGKFDYQAITTVNDINTL
ncbi:hypothetical protein Xszus_00484 [Xenorhabdus szentirmaii]|uniref:Uncharacterized protein n=1 Tax=Xenorhabdus szentirmaii DSM 16338 TaxID=1427518 RepID=W1IVH2_9GAMM|nr:hypothetical protein Xsze_03622 [Xenorhabdus szentirmaii DSM 16338]PHM40809.1 hypothetical protein Xszus_00484 [Xenorhabdus szentirmaii]CDL81833.1 hypothetical protein XSR1_160048 [Xenorhabdus szentirmaii DSM 16338]